MNHEDQELLNRLKEKYSSVGSGVPIVSRKQD